MVSEEDETRSLSQYHKEFYLYCDNTDLHGWQYFKNLRGKSPVYRCMWGLVIFSSIVTASVILTYAFLEYVKDAVQTTYDPTLGTVNELYFPTVTLCNINQIRQSFASELDLSDHQLTQIKRFLYFGSDEDMTDEEVLTVEEIATRKVVYLKGHYVTRVRRKTASWSTFREEYEKDFEAFNSSHISKKKSFYHNIQRFAVQDLGTFFLSWWLIRVHGPPVCGMYEYRYSSSKTSHCCRRGDDPLGVVQRRGEEPGPDHPVLPVLPDRLRPVHPHPPDDRVRPEAREQHLRGPEEELLRQHLPGGAVREGKRADLAGRRRGE